MSRLNDRDVEVDVLVVGSGPVGSAFARRVRAEIATARILMVDAGPAVTTPPGLNVRNLTDDERTMAERRSEGRVAQPTSPRGRIGDRIVARPGTFLVAPPARDADPQTGMPAAAMSRNVGGMGSHWTCACPEPGDGERIGFLGDAFDAAFSCARDLLHVTGEAFPVTPDTIELLDALGAHFDDGRPHSRRVQPMPLACQPRSGGMPHWTGVAEILEDLGHDPGFELWPETACVRLLPAGGADGRRVSGAVLLRPGGSEVLVRPRAVMVAADALRTPQLLWASGIRPDALGRYLNDQPQIHSVVALEQTGAGVAAETRTDTDEPGLDLTRDVRPGLTGVLWVPFHRPTTPFHIQIMQLGTAPLETASLVGPRNVVALGAFTAKDIRPDDRLEFSDDSLDPDGLPTFTVHYRLTDEDHARIGAAVEALRSLAEVIGEFLPGAEPVLLPAGSSMHYQGTVRMGEVDDGASVCDRNSRVWGFENLFVGGNGVIPTATACNPTASSVALAVLAAARVRSILSDRTT